MNKNIFKLGSKIGIVAANNILRKRGNMSLTPMCNGEQPRPLWEDLLLVSIPTFIGSVIPIVVGHFLMPDEPQTNVRYVAVPPGQPGQPVNYIPVPIQEPVHTAPPSTPPPAFPESPNYDNFTKGNPESLKAFTARKKAIKNGVKV